ncbi:MAG: hypothetical protein VXW84_12440 [Verrucomicrobiota bacterium]|nr:hypothetical protein [Verrucomicrobiota bacterium]
MKSPFHRPTRLILLKPGGHGGILPPLSSGIGRARPRPPAGGSEMGKVDRKDGGAWFVGWRPGFDLRVCLGFCRWLGLRSKGHGPITTEKSLTQ